MTENDVNNILREIDDLGFLADEKEILKLAKKLPDGQGYDRGFIEGSLAMRELLAKQLDH